MITAITNVTVVCPTRPDPLDDATVVIREGLIAEVATGGGARNHAAGGSVVDGSGLFLLPGIIDVHTHLSFRQTYGPLAAQLRSLPESVLGIRAARAALQYLRQGITTTRDLGSMFEVACDIRDLIEASYLPGPRVLAAGSPLSVSGGHSISAVRHVDGPYDARKAGRQWAAKYDWVKIFASYDPARGPRGELARPEFQLDEITAITAEAHNVGKRVAAHANGTVAIRNCIDGGVDSIEHGIYLNEELADAMVAIGASLVPTLSGYMQNVDPSYGRGDAWGKQLAAMVEAHHESYQTAVRQGVHIALGLDSLGELDEELGLLKDLGGLDERQLLRVATLNGAETLGLEAETGSIEVGKRADLLLVGSDPSLDLRAGLKDLRLVIKKGNGTHPESVGLSLQKERADFTSYTAGWRGAR